MQGDDAVAAYCIGSCVGWCVGGGGVGVAVPSVAVASSGSHGCRATAVDG